jgi:hypothetical protein
MCIIISIISCYLYYEDNQLKISSNYINNLRNLEENITSVYIETFSDFKVNMNDNFKDTIEEFKVNINDNFKDTIEKLEIPMIENNKYISTIKNIMIKNKIDEILMDILGTSYNSDYGRYYNKIRDINLNFKHCFPASNIYNIFETLIDIDYENNIFSFNYDKKTDTDENELDNIKPISKLDKIINENLNINNYTYSPCDKRTVFSHHNSENIIYYKNKFKCVYQDRYKQQPFYYDIQNQKYYFEYNNRMHYSTINSSECLLANINYNQDNLRHGGYIINFRNTILDYDNLPIIKPIKLI